MNPILLEFYLLFLIILLMIGYAGFEGTLRVFAYIDLQLKYTYVRIQMWNMKRKLKSQLMVDTQKFLKEYDVKRKSDQD